MPNTRRDDGRDRRSNTEWHAAGFGLCWGLKLPRGFYTYRHTRKVYRVELTNVDHRHQDLLGFLISIWPNSPSSIMALGHGWRYPPGDEGKGSSSGADAPSSSQGTTLPQDRHTSSRFPNQPSKWIKFPLNKLNRVTLQINILRLQTNKPQRSN